MWMNIRQVILTKEINTITFINHITQGANTASAYIILPPNITHTVQKYIYLLLDYSRSLVLMGYANTVWETNTNDRCSKFGSSSIQAATDQISNDSSQANRKDGGKILIRCHSLYTWNNQDGFRNAQLAAS